MNVCNKIVWILHLPSARNHVVRAASRMPRGNALVVNGLQKAAFRVAKSGLLEGGKRPFEGQTVANFKPVSHPPQPSRREGA